MLRSPTMQELSFELSDAARRIARTLRHAGHRAWIVGGAPRDLALGRRVVEIDMASKARPEEVEALFRETIPVGRAFGTVVVRAGGVDVQHTTFRSERGYGDARHPDDVGFGATPEEDSQRRDFTCNAIYLDPLDDTVFDPQRGLDDLAAGRLACVGDARARFREDGLRLLRMARFAARASLDLAPGVLDAARASVDALRGVSPERVLDELSRILATDRAAHGVEILCAAGVLPRCLPAPRADAPDLRSGACARAAMLRGVPAPPGVALGFAALLGSSVADEGTRDAELAALVDLRASRALQREVREILRIARVLASDRAQALRRADRVRLVRAEEFAAGLALAEAWAAAEGGPTLSTWRAEHEEWRAGGGAAPEPLVTAADLARTPLPRGPAWGAVLHEVESLQLDGTLTTRDEALAWLARRAAEPR